MKLLSLIVVFSLSAVLAASAVDDWRKFSNPDGSKSFQGVLVAYSEESGKVKIRLKGGQEAALTLDKLSEEDGEWIKTSGVWAIRASQLVVKLKHDSLAEEAIVDHVGRAAARTMRSHKEGYEIIVTNSSEEAISGLSFDWAFFVRRRINGDTEIRPYKGKFDIITLEAGQQHESNTSYVLIDESEKLMGMALRIKHGKDVIRMVETQSGMGARLNRETKEEEAKKEGGRR